MIWLECEKILIMLAQRKGSEWKHLWYGTNPHDINGDWVCLICGGLISRLDIKTHGMQHLKESNLLPFI